MLELLLLVITLGLADSLNPVTIAIAVYLATTEAPRRRLVAYTAGVFAAYFGGGLVLTLGPAAVLHAAVSKHNSTFWHAASAVIGVGALVFAGVLWHQRHRIASTEVPKRVLNPGSAFALGAGMTVVDLPTALPYFAVIAAIVRSPHTMLLGKVILLAIFNVCYVLPLIGIAVLATFAGERAPHILERLRVGTARWAPVVLSGITLVAGLWLTASGLRHLM